MTMCGFLRNGGKGNEKKNIAESKIMLIIMWKRDNSNHRNSQTPIRNWNIGLMNLFNFNSKYFIMMSLRFFWFSCWEHWQNFAYQSAFHCKLGKRLFPLGKWSGFPSKLSLYQAHIKLKIRWVLQKYFGGTMTKK